MSAWVVSKEHIHAMLRSGLRHLYPFPLKWFAVRDVRDMTFPELDEVRRALNYETADQVGRMLIDECVTSVRHRYDATAEDEDLPGPISQYWLGKYVFPEGEVMGDGGPTQVEGLKLIACYEYQSCEHPEWETSEAKQFCDALRKHLVEQLKGYDEAPWEWRDGPVPKTVWADSPCGTGRYPQT